LQNNLIFDDLPININKLIEKINIFFLKSVYQSNSQIYFKDYILNLNNKTIFLNKKKLKLAEKEVKIILFLLSEKTPQKTSVLQKKIWGYRQDLETHTVETHIYRLRKKIKNHFNDATFLKKNKNGYLL
jgi:DNA-binding response OmpR family regulator